MSVIVGGIIYTEDIARRADNERVIKRYSGGIVPPDVMVHRDSYVSHDYARKLLAQLIGTSIDNIEYNNGSYYACARNTGGVITHKYEIT